MKVKNIWGSTINVQGTPLKNDEVREVKEDAEIKKLVKYGYLFVMEV